jgi:hypothetical protein
LKIISSGSSLSTTYVIAHQLDELCRLGNILYRLYQRRYTAAYTISSVSSRRNLLITVSFASIFFRVKIAILRQTSWFIQVGFQPTERQMTVAMSLLYLFM